MFAIGVDLGQTRDHSAISVVERDDYHGILMVRFLERVPLGTPYPLVVERIVKVARRVLDLGTTAIAVDATGVGAPVVEMLRTARVGCDLTAVTITSGDSETQKGGSFNAPKFGVPKKDLIAGLQLSMQSGELKIARKLREAGALIKELVDVTAVSNAKGNLRIGADASGQHDDLVIALALACWQAKRQPKPTIGFQPRRVV